MELLIQGIVVVIWIFLAGFLTGKRDYPFGKSDDERKREIKKRSITQSWLTVLLFLVINVLYGFFNIRGGATELSNTSLELFYIGIAVLSYMMFYGINSKKMSA
ncbi:hypothetical protein [Alkalihalobacillus sp. CinArs1]|uniref:hypothetical protein n=1 Tax=Alkalihalobacillus sp. CinArs1 TaxID=2995314 RepID=UPI0022DCE731|nr:hypothetical protein [Alkalihalobacillus sp. CinArs1]